MFLSSEPQMEIEPAILLSPVDTLTIELYTEDSDGKENECWFLRAIYVLVNQRISICLYILYSTNVLLRNQI